MSDLHQIDTRAPGEQSWQVLGGMRFILASIVVCGHLVRFSPDSGIINHVVLRFGMLDPVAAVLGFLVISGFSIAHSIEQSPAGFYRRRLIRLYPLYLVGLLMTVVVHALAGPNIKELIGEFVQPNALTLGGNFLFLQGFLVHAVEANRPLWTLAVEVFCYALAPLLAKFSQRCLIGLMVFSAGAFCVYPQLHWEFYSRLIWGLPTIFLFWAWIGGFLLYRCNSRIRFALVLICISVLCVTVNRIALTPYASLTLVTSIAAIALSDRIELGAFLGNISAYAGELSYPLYVVHVPVLILGYAVLGLRSSVVLVILAMTAAAVSYHLIDAPIRKFARRAMWMRRLFPSSG